MVPDILGDELCNQIEGQDRLAFSFMVEFDEQMQVRAHSFADNKILSPGTRLKVRIEMVFPREQGLGVTPVLDED